MSPRDRDPAAQGRRRRTSRACARRGSRARASRRSDPLAARPVGGLTRGLAGLPAVRDPGLTVCAGLRATVPAASGASVPSMDLLKLVDRSWPVARPRHGRPHVRLPRHATGSSGTASPASRRRCCSTTSAPRAASSAPPAALHRRRRRRRDRRVQGRLSQASGVVPQPSRESRHDRADRLRAPPRPRPRRNARGARAALAPARSPPTTTTRATRSARGARSRS